MCLRLSRERVLFYVDHPFLLSFYLHSKLLANLLDWKRDQVYSKYLKRTVLYINTNECSFAVRHNVKLSTSALSHEKQSDSKYNCALKTVIIKKCCEGLEFWLVLTMQ